METNEISAHQLRVYQYAADHEWFTSAQLAQGAGVAPRTARAHARRFVQLGLFDQAEVFPAHRYRLSPLAEKRNAAMVRRLGAAAEALGPQWKAMRVRVQGVTPLVTHRFPDKVRTCVPVSCIEGEEGNG